MALELGKEISELHVTDDHDMKSNTSLENDDAQITCFTEKMNDNLIHFQIIRLAKQIYVWIGSDSAKFGHLYAAARTRPNNVVSVTSLLGGSADNVGAGIGRHLALKTGLSLVLACNITKDNPMLEAAAERKLLEKFRSLGYIKSKHPVKCVT